MQHKQVAATVTETDRGEFTAIAACYTVDRQHERIARGAFTRTIAAWLGRGRQVPVHWNHSGEAKNVIGTVDPKSMREVSEGLYVEGQLHLEDSSTAREAWRLLKHDAIGLSFGYMVGREHADSDGVTVLDELDLYEISITPAPANPDTRVLSAKSAEPPEDGPATKSNAELRADLEELVGKKFSEPVRIARFEV